MTASVESRLQAFDLTDLARQALRNSSVEVVDWQYQWLAAGGSERIAGGLGLYRVTGNSRDQGGSYFWSLILKISSGTATGSQEPSSWNYWKREALAYQSGLLDYLPGSLAAPRCCGVEEYPDDEMWIWLEDVHEDVPEWTMAQHGQAARHLGEFNGAYLAGYPLPQAEPWFSKGRVREWLVYSGELIEPARKNVETPLGRRFFPGDSFERAVKVQQNHQPLLEAFERLPVCFCHHDAFRRNLLARRSEAGACVTVAIDWAVTGYGRVGEEIGGTTANDLIRMEVPTDRAKELDQTVFSNYVEGLRAVGWKGDMRLARLAYLVNSATIGLTWVMFHTGSVTQVDWPERYRAVTNVPVDEAVEAAGEALLFFLDLADEAFKLAEDLK